MSESVISESPFSGTASMKKLHTVPLYSNRAQPVICQYDCSSSRDLEKNAGNRPMTVSPECRKTGATYSLHPIPSILSMTYDISAMSKAESRKISGPLPAFMNFSLSMLMSIEDANSEIFRSASAAASAAFWASVTAC